MERNFREEDSLVFTFYMHWGYMKISLGSKHTATLNGTKFQVHHFRTWPLQNLTCLRKHLRARFSSSTFPFTL